MVSTTINRPKHAIYKNLAKFARLQRRRRKLNETKKVYKFVDAEIIPASMIRKHQKNPNTNIELSGKKKRKILNQIKRDKNAKLRKQNEEKNQMQVEVGHKMKKETKEQAKEDAMDVE